MNGEEYKYLDEKIGRIRKDLSDLNVLVVRIDTRINTLWKAVGVVGSVIASIGAYIGFN